MRRLPLVTTFLLLSGCYPGLEAPSSGPRAHLVLAPSEQLTEQKQPPGIYVYKRADNCSGIQRPDYPAADAESGERPYIIQAGQPIAIGWHSDVTGRITLGSTPSGIVVPMGPGTSRMCSNTLTFTPVDGETYRISDARVDEGCQYEVTDSSGRPVPHLRREMWPEAKKDGAHCERIPASPAP